MAGIPSRVTACRLQLGLSLESEPGQAAGQHASGALSHYDSLVITTELASDPSHTMPAAESQLHSGRGQGAEALGPGPASEVQGKTQLHPPPGLSESYHQVTVICI